MYCNLLWRLNISQFCHHPSKNLVGIDLAEGEINFNQEMSPEQLESYLRQKTDLLSLDVNQKSSGSQTVSSEGCEQCSNSMCIPWAFSAIKSSI